MPYQNWEQVNPAIKGIDPPPSLAQANMIQSWAHSIEQKGSAKNPWAAAIALFKRTHHVEGGKWVENEGSNIQHSAGELLDLLFELQIADLPEQNEPPIDSDFAFVIDLMADVPQTAEGRPDFSQPFRILPCGPIHRGARREITAGDIDQFADNWVHREERGIRRRRVIVDLEHQPGGIGEYANIFSRGSDGLWAKINLSRRGQKALAERDFWYFSPAVAWSSQDVVTGEFVKNQIVGGALTNYPILGEMTALPVVAYSEFALFRLWQDGHQVEGYASKTEEGKEYPSSAYLIVEDPNQPTTWHLRYKEYVDGRLQTTKNMCGRAAASLNPSKPYRGNPYQGPHKEEAKRKLRNIYLNELKVPREEVPPHLFAEGEYNMSEFTDQERGMLRQALTLFGSLFPKKGDGDTMPDQKVDAQAFADLQQSLATLKTQVETLSAERDQLKQKVDASETQLAAEVYARLLQEMKEHIGQYSCLALPTELAKDAPAGTMTAQEHFAWLKTQDTTDDKKHWTFFNAVFAAANKALKEAQPFSELGTSEQSDISEDALLDQKAQAYAKEHKVPYSEALKAVASDAQPA